DHHPLRPAQPARPGLDDRPPEEQARAKEKEVLHLMPKFKAKREFIQTREMPSDVAHRKGKQAHERMSEKVSQPLETFKSEEGADPVLQHGSRQPAQQR